MGASVRIEDEAFADQRYERLASEAGLANADHARGVMLRIWRQCTLEQRHTLDVADVSAILGERGVNALVAARLGEIVGDQVRIKGTKGRIEWLKKLRKNGRFGKLGGRPKKNPQGLSKKPRRVSENTQTETPPAPAPAPAPVPTHTYEEEPMRAPSALRSEPATALAPLSPAVIAFPVVGDEGGEEPLTRSDVEEWQRSFPAVDVEQALRSMRAWCVANPTKRKTRRGLRAFVVKWLAKEQDRGGGGARAAPAMVNRKDRETQDVLDAIADHNRRLANG